MRLWTIHPRHLDARGLVALWREALLAQKVLAGKTRGYRHHPQLQRFREHRQPRAAISAYLAIVAGEAIRRGYNFDKSKISRPRSRRKIPETRGQLMYEWKHLKAKLRRRSPKVYVEIQSFKKPDAHPLFKIIPGKIRSWEKI
jgi:hypothetical protein